jgi:malate/lactate dehydrogenase
MEYGITKSRDYRGWFGREFDRLYLDAGPRGQHDHIIDLNKDKAEGDALDMADGMSFLSVPKVINAAGYEGVKDAEIVIITAGAAQKPGETRLDLLGRNAAILMASSRGSNPIFRRTKSIVLVVSVTRSIS